MKLYTATAMKTIDRRAIDECGISSLTLMENAATAMVRTLVADFPERLEGRLVIFSGKGNNGGDGMAVARLLAKEGYAPQVMITAPPEKLSNDALHQFDLLRPSGVSFEVVDSREAAAVAAQLLREDTVLDALLGTGLGGPLRGGYLELVNAINVSGAFVVAVDVPSGLSGDSPVPPGKAVMAGLTLTLQAAKPCLFTPEGAPYAGIVRVLNIGIPPEATVGEIPAGEVLDESWARPFFSPREVGCHKGNAGRVLIVAGGRGKSGAAVLAALGALRAGAGLVTIASPTSSQPLIATYLPEAMTLPLPETINGALGMDALTPIMDFAERVDAIGLGPGLGNSPETLALCRELYSCLELPTTVDADALNAFEGVADELAIHRGVRVLTPHPGEMGRLTALKASKVLASRYELVPDRAAAWQTVVLLKGYRSLISAPGVPWRMNLSGGPHMAGPGFGDVLTGVISSLLSRRMTPFDAASLGAWWHGAAADAAFSKLGGYGLLSSEAADALPEIEGRLRNA